MNRSNYKITLVFKEQIKASKELKLVKCKEKMLVDKLYARHHTCKKDRKMTFKL